MIQIKQLYVDSLSEKENLEKSNHVNAFEYLPQAKGVSYNELALSDTASFLTIKVGFVSGQDNSKEHELINSNSFMRLLAGINRVFAKHSEFETKSISYEQALEENTSKECMIANALIISENQEPLTDKEVLILEKELSGELGLNNTIETSIPIEPAESILKEIEVSIESTPVINSESNDNVSNVVESSINSGSNIEMDEPIKEVETENVTNTFVDANASNGIHSTSLNGINPFTGIQSPLTSFLPFASLNLPSKEEEASKRPSEPSNDMTNNQIVPNEQTESPIQSDSSITIESLVDTANSKEFADTAEPPELTTESDIDFSLESVMNPPEDNVEVAEHVSDDKENDSHVEDSYEKFIASIYQLKEVPSEQKKAYQEASMKKPFLNEITDYIPLSNILELEDDDPIYEICEEDAFAQTTASKQKLAASFNQTMDYFTNVEHTMFTRTLKGEIEKKSFLEDIELYINKNLKIPEEDKEMFLKKLERSIFSYYVLTPAINDPKVTDIKVLAADNINVKVGGEHYKAEGLSFINNADLDRFIEGLIIKNRLRITSPICVFTDKDFNEDYILRFNLCLAPINSPGTPYLHIRKVPKKKTTVKDLVEAGMLDEKIAKYLLDKIQTSKGIVFSGPSASGKTTLMNALIDYIPKKKSILCIQESEELFSHIHPNAYFQHMLKDARGNLIVGLSELGQNGLVCDAGYFIIGECKGQEVRDLLRASNTGHKCWCSVHSQSSRETIGRLADYVKYGSDYSLKEATRMLKDLEVIVYIEGFKVTEITEISGYDEDKERILYRSIYNRKLEEESEN